MSERPLGPELAALESALLALAPAPAGINRDRLLFRAGQASASRRGWAWPAATAALALVAVALGSAWLLRPGPPERVERVYVRVPAGDKGIQASPMETPSPSRRADAAPLAPERGNEWDDTERYLKLRNQVIALGADSLPETPVTRAPRRLEPLEDLPDVPPGTFPAGGSLLFPLAQPSGDRS
jgi:hypothetical protein